MIVKTAHNLSLISFLLSKLFLPLPVPLPRLHLLVVAGGGEPSGELQQRVESEGEEHEDPARVEAAAQRGLVTEAGQPQHAHPGQRGQPAQLRGHAAG